MKQIMDMDENIFRDSDGTHKQMSNVVGLKV
jgi:hypothetical protein